VTVLFLIEMGFATADPVLVLVEPDIATSVTISALIDSDVATAVSIVALLLSLVIVAGSPRALSGSIVTTTNPIVAVITPAFGIAVRSFVLVRGRDQGIAPYDNASRRAFSARKQRKAAEARRLQTAPTCPLDSHWSAC
jgi:hypothetical protein